ncbi:MAG: lamin tail domain-containing protein, partial [Verrucomicrobia bacterium]|nr:lamin tail domain-containing protein [Verrucomicrobiota bacterium]
MKRIVCIALFAAGMASAQDTVVISEFMANNSRTLADENGDFSDWIELFNLGSSPVNLAGWQLTDHLSRLDKWTFPATNINPGQFLIVWASNKDRRTPGAPLHTNFRLEASPGEYLALVRPDDSIATEFRPAYPPQVQDVSYGFFSQIEYPVLVPTGAVARLLVPANDDLGALWIGANEPFDDRAWTSGRTGVGFTFTPSFAQEIATDVGAGMRSNNASLYLRIPFVVTNAAEFDRLTLSVKYNDGFSAWLNGLPLASRYAPDTLSWNSVATAYRDLSESLIAEEIDLTSRLSLLRVGTNLLAIQALNNADADANFLIKPQLTARILRGFDTNAPRYFPVPTPGAQNNNGSTVLGPVISEVANTP